MRYSITLVSLALLIGKLKTRKFNNSMVSLSNLRCYLPMRKNHELPRY
jgi:hypothetical protein